MPRDQRSELLSSNTQDDLEFDSLVSSAIDEIFEPESEPEAEPEPVKGKDKLKSPKKLKKKKSITGKKSKKDTSSSKSLKDDSSAKSGKKSSSEKKKKKIKKVKKSSSEKKKSLKSSSDDEGKDIARKPPKKKASIKKKTEKTTADLGPPAWQLREQARLESNDTVPGRPGNAKDNIRQKPKLTPEKLEALPCAFRALYMSNASIDKPMKKKKSSAKLMSVPGGYTTQAALQKRENQSKARRSAIESALESFQ